MLEKNIQILKLSLIEIQELHIATLMLEKS